MKKKAELAKERAKAKAQKEEQDRSARPHAVTNLNVLDIPAELAVIFNKVDGKKRLIKCIDIVSYFIMLKLNLFFFFIAEWQAAHNERQLVKVVGPIVEIPEQYTLPSDIDPHAFSKFTNIYFKVWNSCARLSEENV